MSAKCNKNPDYCKNTNYYPCCYIGPPGPPGPMGPQGYQGETGLQGPRGLTGPSSPQSFVQLYDRNFTNEITTNGTLLNLSNEGINPLYTSGGYTLSTGTVTNDTLNLPEAGLYHIDISLIASFLYAVEPAPTPGNSYQILFNILDENDATINQLPYEGVIPEDYETAIAEVLLSRSFLHNWTGQNPAIKIVLSNFNFTLAFENMLSAFSIIVVVQKWVRP